MFGLLNVGDGQFKKNNYEGVVNCVDCFNVIPNISSGKS